ncbi:MJ1477/TM1410 family putative glycoside hydrolase [Deinococcus planocerae]|uniref:MJ1477/TM1410 family putative glycoside hydrolase n=1 Tax=Deinococcus planocerae TaxID=1737569 RepID=UPI000C7ED5BB|nr:MJ1477/TM1410 family putative glycoside hydrolase [Deinococcus planocerae]
MTRTGVLVSLAALAALTLCAGCDTGSASVRASGPELHLRDVQSWAYQLQNYPRRLEEVAASRFQLVVVDFSATGADTDRWTPREVALARRDKLLFAYLSIGEAEDYRSYWRPGWGPGRPGWISAPDPGWPGNYVVEYWQPEWQALILAYLETVITQGFDGAYLDLVDAYQYFPERAGARREMIDWVCRLTAQARSRRADFRIITQNASELIWEEGGRLARCIDATAQEETFYAATDRRTSETYRSHQLGDYAEYRRRGLPVLTVDYADDSQNVRDAYATARAHGLIPYVADLELDRLRLNPGDPQSPPWP